MPIQGVSVVCCGQAPSSGDPSPASAVETRHQVERQARPVRLVAPIYAFALFFLIVGGVAIVVGVHDAALARVSFGVTAGSAVLLVIAFVLGAAVWELARLRWNKEWEEGKRPPCSPVVLVALMLTILLGIYVFFSAIATAGAQRFVVVAAAVALIAVGVAGLGLFGRDVQKTLPRIGGAVALTLLGTLVGASEFWYQNQYLPSHAARAVTLNVSLARVAEQPQFDVVRATIGYQAVGGKSVSVIGSVYTLTGSQVTHCVRPPTVERVSNYFNSMLIDPARIRFASDTYEGRPTVLAAGKFVGDGKRLEPNVVSTRTLDFFVPPQKYQLLRLRAQLFAIPGSVQLSEVTPPTFRFFRDDNELYAYWHIDDNSWLHDLIDGRERWVVLQYLLVDPGHVRARRGNPAKTDVSPGIRVTARFPAATWGKKMPDEKTTMHLFGDPLEPSPPPPPPTDASDPFATAEFPLDNVRASCP